MWVFFRLVLSNQDQNKTRCFANHKLHQQLWLHKIISPTRALNDINQLQGGARPALGWSIWLWNKDPCLIPWISHHDTSRFNDTLCCGFLCFCCMECAPVSHIVRTHQYRSLLGWCWKSFSHLRTRSSICWIKSDRLKSKVRYKVLSHPHPHPQPWQQMLPILGRSKKNVRPMCSRYDRSMAVKLTLQWPYFWGSLFGEICDWSWICLRTHSRTMGWDAGPWFWAPEVGYRMVPVIIWFINPHEVHLSKVTNYLL